MELFVRLFVWILNRTYLKRESGSLYASNPMDEKVLIEHDAARELERSAERHERIVETFKSTAAPVAGAVDYAELEWETFSRVVETPQQFEFYSDRSIAKVIEKSKFTDQRQLQALRRVIRRKVAECKLLD